MITIVTFDNGEEYDDQRKWIIGVFNPKSRTLIERAKAQAREKYNYYSRLFIGEETIAINTYNIDGIGG